MPNQPIEHLELTTSWCLAGQLGPAFRRGGRVVIVEYIRYTVPAEQAEEFERSYRRAGAALAADPHCLRGELARGVEEPAHFVVRIEWDSVEGHEQGFWTGPRFPEFLAAVRPFFSAIEEMKHYELRPSHSLDPGGQ